MQSTDSLEQEQRRISRTLVGVIQLLVVTMISNTWLLISPISSWMTVIGYVFFLAVGIPGVVRGLPMVTSLRKPRLIITCWSIYVLWMLGLFAYLYKVFGLLDTHTGAVLHDGGIALYFSLVTFTTLGYGDFAPATAFGRATASIEALTGYIILGIFVAILVSIFGERRFGAAR